MEGAIIHVKGKFQQMRLEIQCMIKMEEEISRD